MFRRLLASVAVLALGLNSSEAALMVDLSNAEAYLPAVGKTALSSNAFFATPTTSGVHPYTCVTNFFVATGGSDANNGTSSLTPWATIHKANIGRAAGDCVNIAAGTYSITTSDCSNHGNSGVCLTNGGNLNSLTGYVTYIGAGVGQTIFTMNGASPGTTLYIGFFIGAPYIILDGIEINGNSNNTGGPGIDAEDPAAHHLIVINSRSHNNGGGGVQFNGADYYAVLWSEMDHNAATNTFNMSGISTAGPQPLASNGITFTATPADSATFHMNFSNNLLHENFVTYSCGASPGCHTDGEGIIVDTTDAPDNAKPYSFPILVQGNAAWGNGGAGIECTNSSNVTFANNSTYNNYLDTNNGGTARAELFNGGSHGCRNITSENNSLQTVIGAGILANNVAIIDFGDGTGDTYASNDTFDGTGGDVSYSPSNSAPSVATFKSANAKWGQDPKYTSLVTPTLTPQAGSPLLGTGLTLPLIPPVSLSGNPQASPPNIGAY